MSKMWIIEKLKKEDKPRPVLQPTVDWIPFTDPEPSISQNPSKDEVPTERGIAVIDFFI